MSIRKILGFIWACMLLLAALAYCYPQKGIAIASWHLRFASIHQLFGAASSDTLPLLNPEDQLAKVSLTMNRNHSDTLVDSLLFYRKFFLENPARFYFPSDNPSFFDELFAEMDACRSEGKLIRILHYGDSQIEQDRISSTLRDYFQKQFGGMGLGLLPAVQPVQTPFVSQSAYGQWTRYIPYGTLKSKADHSRYGPMLAVCQVEGPAMLKCSTNARQHAAQFRTCTSLRVLLGHNSPGFRATLLIDSLQMDRWVETPDSDFVVLTWKTKQPISSFSLYFDGSAEIYGIMMDGEEGVAVDNVPMRGCSGLNFTQTDADLLQKAYQAMNVRLIIMEYGGNRMPSISDSNDVLRYRNAIGRQIRYLKALAPQAKILFIGPADMSCMLDGKMQTYPMLEESIEALKTAALENGAAFWDMYQVMGGHNSMLSWTKTSPPLASPDHIHFSYKGANKMAALLEKSFSVCYDYYHFRATNALGDSAHFQPDSLYLQQEQIVGKSCK